MKKFLESAQVVSVVFNCFFGLVFRNLAVFEKVFYVLRCFHRFFVMGW